MFDHGASASLSFFTDPQTGGVTVKPGDNTVIYDSQTPADSVFYIQQGQVRLYTVNADGTTRLCEILGTGEWFGAGALAGQKAYTMRAVAVTSVTLVQVRVEQLFAALTRNPSQHIELTRQVAAKLMSQTQESSRLVFEDCNQRLISALIRFSQSAASTPRDGGVVLRITHEQLAQAVGVARETVSLALTQLRQQNLLRTGRNQLVFNPENLRQFSDNNGSKMPRLAESLT
jgi:CRP/FNR family transcriptional regulator, cyclic AMP receptor protein